MRDMGISNDLHQDHDSTDFSKNGDGPFKSCDECECNNNGLTVNQVIKQSADKDSGVESSSTNGNGRVTFELQNDESTTDVFVLPSQPSDMTVNGQSSSTVELPPVSIARRRGASLTLELKDRVEQPGPSRNISVPMEHHSSHFNVSESEMKLQEYEIDKNEQVDRYFVAETERVVRSFMVSSYERETEKPLVLPQDEEVSPEVPSPDETPIIPELFDQASAQDNLFRDSQITWCRIIALLSFGYRLGVALFRHGVNHFVQLVVRLVTKFILTEHIYRWIIQRGGWFATLTYNLVNSGSFDTTTNFLFYSIWCMTLFTVMCFTIRNLAK